MDLYDAVAEIGFPGCHVLYGASEGVSPTILAVVYGWGKDGLDIADSLLCAGWITLRFEGQPAVSESFLLDLLSRKYPAYRLATYREQLDRFLRQARRYRYKLTEMADQMSLSFGG